MLVKFIHSVLNYRHYVYQGYFLDLRCILYVVMFDMFSEIKGWYETCRAEKLGL